MRVPGSRQSRAARRSFAAPSNGLRPSRRPRTPGRHESRCCRRRPRQRFDARRGPVPPGVPGLSAWRAGCAARPRRRAPPEESARPELGCGRAEPPRLSRPAVRFVPRPAPRAVPVPTPAAEAVAAGTAAHRPKGSPNPAAARPAWGHRGVRPCGARAAGPAPPPLRGSARRMERGDPRAARGARSYRRPRSPQRGRLPVRTAGHPRPRPGSPPSPAAVPSRPAAYRGSSSAPLGWRPSRGGRHFYPPGSGRARARRCHLIAALPGPPSARPPCAVARLRRGPARPALPPGGGSWRPARA